MNKILKILIYLLSITSTILLIYYYKSYDTIYISDIVKLIILVLFINLYITIINIKKNINKYKVYNNSYIFYLIISLALIGSIIYGMHLNNIYLNLTSYDQYVGTTFDSFFIKTFKSLYFIFSIYLILSFKSKKIIIKKR